MKNKYALDRLCRLLGQWSVISHWSRSVFCIVFDLNYIIAMYLYSIYYIRKIKTCNFAVVVGLYEREKRSYPS